jgi:SAM-dependent methyltransferase
LPGEVAPLVSQAARLTMAWASIAFSCDDEQAMREILRVLRPGGYAILQVPIDHQAEATNKDPR